MVLKESLLVNLYECFCELFKQIDDKYVCHFGELEETEENAINISFRGNTTDNKRTLDGNFINYKTAMVLNIHGSATESLADTMSFIETFVDYFSKHFNFCYTDDETGEIKVVILSIDLRGNINYLGKTNSKSIPCWSVNYTVTYGK